MWEMCHLRWPRRELFGLTGLLLLAAPACGSLSRSSAGLTLLPGHAARPALSRTLHPGLDPEAIAKVAESLVGKRRLFAHGQELELDSVGLVRAVFAAQGRDVFDAPAFFDPTRTGVEIVYQHAAIKGRLHAHLRPSKGDLVFFGRTRDANRDGVLDAVSHVGIVSAVAADGTATIVTTTMTKVVALPLDLLARDDAAKNGRLLTPAAPREPRSLAELFYTFATLR